MPNAKKEVVGKIALGAGELAGAARDYLSRMKRAKEQGYEGGWYHGSDADISEYDPSLAGSRGANFGDAVFLTSSPKVASGYSVTLSKNKEFIKASEEIERAREKAAQAAIEFGSQSKQGKEALNEYRIASKEFSRNLKRATEYESVSEGANVSASMIKGNFLEVDAGGQSWRAVNKEAIEKARSEGYDGVKIRNVVDAATTESSEASDVVAVFDAKNIRSEQAAFDPAKKDSPNLLASKGAGILPYGALALGGLGYTDEDAEAGVITRGGKRLINAWHGTPHEVDKFSMDKIGTGEGAQAYGHGLYFADARATGEGYKDALSNESPDAAYKRIMRLNNEVGAGLSAQEASNLESFIRWGDLRNPSEVVEHFVNTHPEWRDAHNRGETLELQQLVEKWRGERPKGNLYNVDIDATPEELLDWDLPLSEQPVALKRLKAFSDEWGDMYPTVKDSLQDFELGNTTGESIYRAFATDSGNAKRATKDLLSETKLKGIQYNDAMSRGAEGGTKNYVVFDDKIISIAKKYGLPMTTATMVAKGTLSPQQAQADAELIELAEIANAQGDEKTLLQALNQLDQNRNKYQPQTDAQRILSRPSQPTESEIQSKRLRGYADLADKVSETTGLPLTAELGSLLRSTAAMRDNPTMLQLGKEAAFQLPLQTSSEEIMGMFNLGYNKTNSGERLRNQLQLGE